MCHSCLLKPSKSDALSKSRVEDQICLRASTYRNEILFAPVESPVHIASLSSHL